MRAGILFDVDGTLVDTNYLHVVAWWHAFRAHDQTIPMHRLHETVGQGSDRFVETILGHQDEDVANSHTDFYGPFLHHLAPLAGAAHPLRPTHSPAPAPLPATTASPHEPRHPR